MPSDVVSTSTKHDNASMNWLKRWMTKNGLRKIINHNSVLTLS